jgi:hypothetical protein
VIYRTAGPRSGTTRHSSVYRAWKARFEIVTRHGVSGNG